MSSAAELCRPSIFVINLKMSLQPFEDCAQGLAADIYILVDSSWSIGEENFKQVLVHIKSMPYRGGSTRTSLGLDFLTRVHMNTGSGSRAVEGAVQVVVVLTDRRSQDDVAVPAQVLRLAGVELFAVGVQDAVDSELREMASQPYDTHVFSVESFLALRDIIQDLVVGICGAVTRSGGAPVAIEASEAQRGKGNEMGPVSLPYECVYMRRRTLLRD